MIESVINYGAVVVAAIATYVLGFLWHGPLFGEIWMKWSGISQKEVEELKKKGLAGMWKSMLGALFIAGIMSYIMAHFVDYTGATTVFEGMQTGFWIWLGFVVTVQLNSVLWEKKPFKLYVLNTGYQFVSLLMMGAILAAWM